MVGPDYGRPRRLTPAAYKEAPGWKVAQPADDAPRGNWWQAYGDPELDALVAQVDISNQTVKAAEARMREALAATQGTRAAYSGGQRQRRRAAHQPRHRVQQQCQHAVRRQQQLQRGALGKLGNRPVGRHPAQRGGKRGHRRRPAPPTWPTQGCPRRRCWHRTTCCCVSRMRRFSCCGRRSQAYERSLQLTRNQYAAGVVARSDIAQAEAQLKSTQAQVVDATLARAQLEHAIAVLDRQAAGGIGHRREAVRRGLPRYSGGRSVDAARTAAGHRRRGAPRRQRQCADRRRAGRVLPGADTVGRRRLAEFD